MRSLALFAEALSVALRASEVVRIGLVAEWPVSGDDSATGCTGVVSEFAMLALWIRRHRYPLQVIVWNPSLDTRTNEREQEEPPLPPALLLRHAEEDGAPLLHAEDIPPDDLSLVQSE